MLRRCSADWLSLSLRLRTNRKEGSVPCGAITMVGAIILTFIITTLLISVIFLWNNHKKEAAERLRLMRENDDLCQQVMNRRERAAYDRGLYNGRGTDALYRQCLKKFSNQREAQAMMSGDRTRTREMEENEDYE